MSGGMCCSVSVFVLLGMCVCIRFCMWMWYWVYSYGFLTNIYAHEWKLFCVYLLVLGVRVLFFGVSLDV